SFDMVILDIVLPRMSGWEVCQHIRQKYAMNLPVLILSALNQTEDVVKGLNAGADDYLGKPFKLSELHARIQALLRRYTGAVIPSANLLFADLKMSLDTHEVWRAGQKIKLTGKEFSLLQLFMSHPVKVLSRDRILEEIWGIDADINTNVVDVYVNYLRNKVDRGFDQKLLHTVFGMGYILREDGTEK
ncbi:MAG: DNA-binding response regulator, partial [Bacteroidetes bacterium]